MKKYIIILSLLIASITFFLYLGKTAIVSTTGKTFAEKVAKKIPDKHKTWIKKTFFKTEFLKLQIRNQNKQLDELLNKERDKISEESKKELYERNKNLFCCKNLLVSS